MSVLAGSTYGFDDGPSARKSKAVHFQAGPGPDCDEAAGGQRASNGLYARTRLGNQIGVLNCWSEYRAAR